MDDDDARRAYAEAGHAPGKRVSAVWYGRICHRHRVAYPTPSRMGPHLDRCHAEPAGYYTAEPEAA
jgi:hypothetical protein